MVDDFSYNGDGNRVNKTEDRGLVANVVTAAGNFGNLGQQWSRSRRRVTVASALGVAVVNQLRVLVRGSEVGVHH